MGFFYKGVEQLERVDPTIGQKLCGPHNIEKQVCVCVCVCVCVYLIQQLPASSAIMLMHHWGKGNIVFQVIIIYN